MSEAIILYRERGSSIDPELLKPSVITQNGTYTAPVTGTYKISCIGGGGGGGGGCRNTYNNLTYYGGGGHKGYLNTQSVNLIQGENVLFTLGRGGSGGTNNTVVTISTSSVVYANSVGGTGSGGGSTSFGTYISGNGGDLCWGSAASARWVNKIISWDNTIIWKCDVCGRTYEQGSAPGWCYNHFFSGGKTEINRPIWSNDIRWNWSVSNGFTSIQQGSWWYLNNDTVTTSGIRTYNGDGGASGRAGNAGFILVIPPQA